MRSLIIVALSIALYLVGFYCGRQIERDRLASYEAQLRNVLASADPDESGYVFGPLRFEGKCLSLIARGPVNMGQWIARHQRIVVAPVGDCPESF